MSDIAALAREIANINEEAKKYYGFKQQVKNSLKIAKNKEEFLKGKTESEIMREYDDYIMYLFGKIRKNLGLISSEIYLSSNAVTQGFKDYMWKEDTDYAKKDVKKEQMQAKGEGKARAKTNVDIDVDQDSFERFLKSIMKKKKDIVVIRDYTLYEQSEYGRLANRYFERLSVKLIKENKKFFEPLFIAMKSSDFRILSNTYVSMMIFSSFAAFFPFFLITLLLVNKFIVIRVMAALIAGLLGSVAVFALIYAYPSTIVSTRRKYMEGELPFVIVHMAAVAGSGAHPMAMFKLILSSGEYRALEPEIKKIVNYVNLFGYSMTTALRLVASTTPLKDFSELLNGIVTTVETGGNLKEYLTIKSQEAMEKYQLKREKYIQNLATFSDVYVGISLVAPMLLFMTLSIINSPLLGGAISGISVGTIAVFGTYVAIPLMNVASLVILSYITPK